MSDPVSSIFERGRSGRVIIRPQVRRSVRMYLTYLQMCAVEGGRKATLNPSWRTQDGRNRMAEYYEAAAKYLGGCIGQIDQSYDSRGLASASLAIIADDPALPADLAASVTLGIPEATRHGTAQSARRGRRGRADGAPGA